MVGEIQMSLSVIRGSDLPTLELLIHDRAHTCTWLLASPREKSVSSLHMTCFSSLEYSAGLNWEARLKDH